MSSLRAELPADLYWLTSQVEDLVKPGAFLCKASDTVCSPGGTRMHGVPDIPADAQWAKDQSPERWMQSPYDGESFWLQLNLAEIPKEVRKPGWPSEGVVWLFVDIAGEWRTVVHFDPRPANEIPWMPQAKKHAAMTWVVADTLSYCTMGTLPEVFHVNYTAEPYDEWVHANYLSKRPGNIQVGGWVCPIQGDFDDCNADMVCAMDQQEIGDNGSIYLHYDSERGFYGSVETH